MQLDLDDLADVMASAIKSAVDPLRVQIESLEQRLAAATPRDGRDGEQGPPGKDGAPGAPGQSVDPSEVEAMVVKAVAALPKPQDGRSVSVDDVAPMIAAEVSKAVEALPRAKDGLGVASTLIDREGHLILTLTDGSAKDVGRVVGRDVDESHVEKFLTDAVAAFPKPKDGKDGKDGLGFEEAKFIEDEHGRPILRLERGADSIEARIPCLIDRGVYKSGESYLKGDGVTWGGSFWIAQKDTSAKPGEGSSDVTGWRLAVRKGDIGKQGPQGPMGLQGKQGLQGPQGPQGY